jgi:hypothetical protein
LKSNKRAKNASGENIDSDPDNMLDQLDKVHKTGTSRKASGSTTPQQNFNTSFDTSSQRSQHSDKSNSNKSEHNISASNKSFSNKSPSNQSFSQKSASNKSPHSNHGNQSIYRNTSKSSDGSIGEPNNSRPNFSTAPQPPKTKLTQPKSSAWGQLPPQGQRYQNPNSVQNSSNSNSFNVNTMGLPFSQQPNQHQPSPQQPSPYLNDRHMNRPGFMNPGINHGNITPNFGQAFNGQAGWGRMPTPQPDINSSANNRNFNNQNPNNQQNHAPSRNQDSWGYH